MVYLTSSSAKLSIAVQESSAREVNASLPILSLANASMELAQVPKSYAMRPPNMAFTAKTPRKSLLSCFQRTDATIHPA